MTPSQRLILVRPADMLLMEIGWTGCTRTGDRITVTDDAATLDVRFPPQSLAEAKVRAGTETAVRAAYRSGTSRLEVGLGLHVGAQIPLTTEGILGALASGWVVGGAVEAPFGLVLDPGTATDDLGDGPRLGHEVEVLTEQGVTSLWQLPLTAPHPPPLAPGAPELDPPGPPSLTIDGITLGSNEANVQEADNAVTAVTHRRPPMVHADFRPLNAVDRGQITVSGPVTVEDLRLTALGASFTAHQVRQDEAGVPSFRWDHRAELGRDARVRVQRTGLLWPFGHPAVFQKTAERVITEGVAGLRLSTELRTTEAVRTFPDDDSAAARAFPFTSVEILTRSVTGLADNWQHFVRPPSSLQPLINVLDQLRQQLPEVQARFDAVHYPRSSEELAESGYPEREYPGQLYGIQNTIAEDEQLLKDDAEARSRPPAVHRGPPTVRRVDDLDASVEDPPPQTERDPRILSSDARDRISRELKELRRQEAQLADAVAARLAALAPFVAQQGNPEGLAKLGDDDAMSRPAKACRCGGR